MNATDAYVEVYAPVESQYTLSPALSETGNLYFAFSYIMSILSQVGPAIITSPLQSHHSTDRCRAAGFPRENLFRQA